MRFLKTKNVIRLFSLLFILIFASFTIGIIGCSSDSDDDGGGSGGVTYTGNTDPVAITASNAKEVLTDANPSIAASLATGLVGGGQANTVDRQSLAFASQPMQAVSKYYDGFDVSSFLSSDENLRTAFASTTESCSGGGTQTMTVDSSTTTQASGSIVYNSCVESGITMTGTVAFTMVYSSGDPYDWDSFSLTFSNTTMNDGEENITMNGTFTVSLSGDVTTATFNLIATESSSGESAYFHNYTIVETEYSTYISQTFNGQFYDSVYGYVTVSTPTPFLINDGADYPHEGVMVAEGAQGTAGGNTKARLTAQDETYCIIEADTNGDGAYDYSSGSLLWTTY